MILCNLSICSAKDQGERQLNISIGMDLIIFLISNWNQPILSYTVHSMLWISLISYVQW